MDSGEGVASRHPEATGGMEINCQRDDGVYLELLLPTRAPRFPRTTRGWGSLLVEEAGWASEPRGTGEARGSLLVAEAGWIPASSGLHVGAARPYICGARTSRIKFGNCRVAIHLAKGPRRGQLFPTAWRSLGHPLREGYLRPRWLSGFLEAGGYLPGLGPPRGGAGHLLDTGLLEAG